MSEVSVHTNLNTGTTLQTGKYCITDVLGRGGFGITYLAEHKTFGKVALKELFLNSGNVHCTRENTTHKTVIPHFDTAQFELFRQRFEEEARTLFALSDIEGVVKVLDIFEENGTSYFSMEFLDGEKLDDYVNRKNLTIPESLQITNALCKTLSAVHARKVLHRDIKPANIIITKSGRVVLIDFGIARSYTDDTSDTHTTFHSPRYAPPEQKIAKNKMGAFSDVYSLGATAYFVFTKQLPQSIEERITEDYKSPQFYASMLPKNINAAITRSLEIKSDARFQTVDEFMTALNGSSTVSISTVTPLTHLEIQKNSMSDANTDNSTVIEYQKHIPAKEESNTTLIEPSPKKIEKKQKSSGIKRYLLPIIGASAVIIGAGIFFLMNSGDKKKTDLPKVEQVQVQTLPPFPPVAVDTHKIETVQPIVLTTPSASNPIKKPSARKTTVTPTYESSSPIKTIESAPIEPVVDMHHKTQIEVCTSERQYINVEIYNAGGNLMNKSPLGDRHEIDISYLAKGKYVLKCTRGQEVICSKTFNISN